MLAARVSVVVSVTMVPGWKVPEAMLMYPEKSIFPVLVLWGFLPKMAAVLPCQAMVQCYLAAAIR